MLKEIDCSSAIGKKERETMKDEEVIVKGKASLFILMCIICLILFMRILLDFFGYFDNMKGFLVQVTTYVIIMIVIYYALKYTIGECQIVVTNKRVYGKSILGSRVDIPLDSVSSVSVFPMLDMIGVSSSSGTIRFMFISNSFGIQKEINKLLIKRQNREVERKEKECMISAADEIKKYKELLDNGAITQEEYDKKKRKLLDL